MFPCAIHDDTYLTRNMHIFETFMIGESQKEIFLERSAFTLKIRNDPLYVS